MLKDGRDLTSWKGNLVCNGGNQRDRERNSKGKAKMQ